MELMKVAYAIGSIAFVFGMWLGQYLTNNLWIEKAKMYPVRKYCRGKLYTVKLNQDLTESN